MITSRRTNLTVEFAHWLLLVAIALALVFLVATALAVAPVV